MKIKRTRSMPNALKSSLTCSSRNATYRKPVLQIESLEGRAMLAVSLLTMNPSHGFMSEDVTYASEIVSHSNASQVISQGTDKLATSSKASDYGSSVRMVSLVQPEGEAAMLDTHPVRLDAQDKLLPWFTPQDKAYGHVSKLSADFIKAAMVGPIDPANGLPAIYTHSEYHPTTFVGSNWPNHPAGRNSMLADSMALYYAYSGDQGVLDAVKALLDYQLSSNGSTPANYHWPNVPWSASQASNPVYGTDNISEGVGMIEPDKMGELGINGYLRFYQITGEVRYLNGAIACADALASHVRVGSATQSPWPFRVNAQFNTLDPQIPEDYNAHVIAPIRLFDELIRLNLGNVAAYQVARTTAWNWLMAYPMVNNNWANYFEDDPKQADNLFNLTQYAPGQTARYLLEHPELDPNWQPKVQGLITWIENTFGGTDAGNEPGLQYGARVISEQLIYKFKMASHTSRFAAINALYAARTGDMIAKDKAFRSLNWASYMARDTGSVIEGPAEFSANLYNWYSDGHGDYIRHFMLGMGAFPEWAPAGENHILSSTSVVKSVTYPTAGTSINYSTFDADSREMLRISFIPATVTVNGVPLDPRADLTQPGWTFDSASGVFKIWHTTGTNIQIAGAPDNEPPTIPTNLSATDGFGQVQLSWNASTDNVGVAGYNIYRSTTAGFTPSAGNLIAQTVGVASTFNNTIVAGTYYYRVIARDAAGNESGSSNAVVGISQSDSTPPAVSITAPADNATLSGTVSIAADATDNIGVVGVSFYANGVLIDAEDLTVPYAVSWITPPSPNGAYVLTAVARDLSGNQTTSAARNVSLQNSPTALGLVAEWSFDDASGLSAQDDSGNGHTGTLSQANWSTTGKYNGALAFNGTNSWVTVADAAALDLTTGMTIEAWVNPTSLTSWRSILLKERTVGLSYSLYATNPDVGSAPPATFINLGIANDTSASGTQALPLNTWTHLAGTYDGSQLKMYVNGSLRQTVNVTGSMTVSDGPLRIGGNSVYSGEFFAGLIDEVRLYNRALALAEIQINMNSPINAPASIVNRQVFYNRSTSSVFGDGTGNPINAIDPTKSALLPGQTTTAANYTNYSRGLNGLVVDITNASNFAAISAASFQFATWSAFPDSTPNFVTFAPSVTVSTFAGGGLNGSDRVKLEFPNNAIQNAWLRVTMLADANTGLTANDIFYFGNARFDVTPTSPFPSQQIVINVFDVNAIRSRQGENSGIISTIHDVDRNGVVNVFDTNAVRANLGVASLRSFTAPSSLQFGLASSGSSSSTASTDLIFADTSWLDMFQVGNNRNRQQKRG
jgi:Concanavalin A-like lectin/glucanases superfamily/Bacterial Ig domain